MTTEDIQQWFADWEKRGWGDDPDDIGKAIDSIKYLLGLRDLYINEIVEIAVKVRDRILHKSDNSQQQVD